MTSIDPGRTVRPFTVTTTKSADGGITDSTSALTSVNPGSGFQISGATQAVIYQFAGVLYSRFGQHAFLGMTVISLAGLAAILVLSRLWKGEVLVGASSNRPGAYTH